jgi:hypothetical protein
MFRATKSNLQPVARQHDLILIAPEFGSKGSAKNFFHDLP